MSLAEQNLRVLMIIKKSLIKAKILKSTYQNLIVWVRISNKDN